MKVFNTTAVCIPEKHYMVDLSERVKEIEKLVDAGKFFTINRARQYGKTTTLDALCKALFLKYEVISLSFEGIGSAGFETEQSFVKAFARKLKREFRNGLAVPENIERDILDLIARKEEKAELDELFDLLQDWCYEVEKGIVLNLKSKIREEDQHKENSPWNIAADFNIDMSLSESGIKGMLDEYEADHHTGMDTAGIARLLRDYTNGYPFLVSRICQLIDEQVSGKLGIVEAWTKKGFDEAIKLILQEDNTLFQSLTKNLNNLPELKAVIRSMLMEGTRIPYSPDQVDIARLQMYGLIRNDHNTVRISNRIFETRLYNLFISEEELQSNAFYKIGDLEKNRFVEGGKLNMRLVMERFIATYTEVFGPLKDRFKEKDGRELFLLYLKPIINGTGNYYIEAQTRDQTRTDVIVDYLGQQYIIELKVWRGPRYNADGEKQISEYLDYFGLTTGYMLSFNFNKDKQPGVHPVQIGDKLLYEGVV